MRPVKLSKLGIHFDFHADEVIWLWRKHDNRRWYSVCFMDTFATRKSIPDVTTTKQSYLRSLVIKYGGVYDSLQEETAGLFDGSIDYVDVYGAEFNSFLDRAALTDKHGAGYYPIPEAVAIDPATAPCNPDENKLESER